MLNNKEKKKKKWEQKECTPPEKKGWSHDNGEKWVEQNRGLVRPGVRANEGEKTSTHERGQTRKSIVSKEPKRQPKSNAYKSK